MSFYVSTATFILLHCDEWDRVVALSRHKFVTGATLLQLVVTGHNFESILPKDHPCHVCFKLADWFQRRRLLNNFPIGSYVKTMSADGGHFGPRSGSLNTILEVDHLRTIDDMFAILAYWFQRRRF